MFRWVVSPSYFKRLMQPQTIFQLNYKENVMAVAGSAQPSIYLELNGRKLNEGAAMLRQSCQICESPTAAWFELHHGTGQCYMRLLGSNLPDLRALYATWLAQVKAEDDE